MNFSRQSEPTRRAIRKVHPGTNFPSLLHPRWRAEQAWLGVVQEAYVHRVSTRKVDDLVKALGLDGISTSELSRICGELAPLVDAFRTRPIAGAHPYVWLDATYHKVRVERRVVVLRRRVTGRVLAEGQAEERRGRQTLHFADRPDDVRVWECAVLMTNADDSLEAITSRPMLLAEVASLAQHAGQSRLLLTLTHAAWDHIEAMIANIQKGFASTRAAAPQLPKLERWRAFVRYIIAKIVATKPNGSSPLGLPPPLPASQIG